MMAACAVPTVDFLMPRTTRVCAIACTSFGNFLAHLSACLTDRIGTLFRGRNVCMYFLLGNCKFGSSVCVYSHDKTYLPSGRWWEDEGKCYLLRAISDSLSPDESSAYMPYTFGILDCRLAWASAHGVEMEEVYRHDRQLAMLIFRVAADVAMESLANKPRGDGSSRGGRGSRGRGRGKGKGRRGGRLDQYDEMDSEVEERMANFGFTEDEVMELLCQGVKPWDDDAWVSDLVSVSLRLSDSHIFPQDVLDALNSL